MLVRAPFRELLEGKLVVVLCASTAIAMLILKPIVSTIAANANPICINLVFMSRNEKEVPHKIISIVDFISSSILQKLSQTVRVASQLFNKMIQKIIYSNFAFEAAPWQCASQTPMVSSLV